MDKWSRYEVSLWIKDTFSAREGANASLLQPWWRKPSASLSVSFLLIWCWRLVSLPPGTRVKKRDALEGLVFESNEAWFLCKGFKGKTSLSKMYLNVIAVLLTSQTRCFFLVSRSVWGSFAKLGGGVESWTTLDLRLSSHRTWHVISRKAL